MNTKKSTKKSVRKSTKMEARFANQEARARKQNKKTTLKVSKRSPAKLVTKEERSKLKAERQARNGQLRASRREAQLQRKQAQQAERDARIAAKAAEKAQRIQDRVITRRKAQLERSRLVFKIIGKRWRNRQPYKSFGFWFHGPLPEDPTGLLKAIKSFMAKRALKAKFQFIESDQCLVMTKTTFKIRNLVSQFVYGYLMGTGFYNI